MDDQQILANLAKEFHELVSNEEVLHTSVETFFDNLIDEMTLGVIFDEHRKFKTGIYDCLKNENEEDITEDTEVDILNQPTDQKSQYYCACPNCDRSVAAEKFAPHLASCMGIGRTRSSRQRRTYGNDSKREEEKQNSKNKGATDLSSSGHDSQKETTQETYSHESPSDLTDNKVDLPPLLTSVGENSLTPDLTDSVSLA